jgi:dihydrofolate reductase
MSMSLDGFVAGPNVSVEEPMGEGGHRLHAWMFEGSANSESTPHAPMTGIDRAVIQEQFNTTGAVILGKRTFDVGIEIWKDTPYPAPSFVLTHTPREPLAQKSATFTFVTDGIESALRQAKAAAGEKGVILMGTETTRQFLMAGLVDEIRINLVPVLLQSGLRLFEDIGTERIELEQEHVLESTKVTHFKYRIIK